MKKRENNRPEYNNSNAGDISAAWIDESKYLETKKKVKQVGKYECKSPCSSCPYRKDAKLKLWAKEEFIDLLKSEQDQIGKVYGCHKQNGSTCIGWLINQDQRNLPSIALRLDLSRNNVTRAYLDSLKSVKPLYKSIEEMIKANYPELL